MKVTWLGQAGLLFENENIKIIVDPYLSDSCRKLSSLNVRRVPVNEEWFDVKPDMIICTHNHMDHLDPETLVRYLKEDSGITVLCTVNGFSEARKFKGNNNYVSMEPGCEWSEKGVRISAVKAIHSEATAIGIIIDDGCKKYYVTGDTLFNKYIFDEIPNDIYALFLPINGVGNNMNMEDAARFAETVNAEKVIPLHWGLFDDINPEDFLCDKKVIPEFYKEIKL